MPTTEQQKHQFNAIYKQLNNEQKYAVDNVEGPVIVNAGPGTGKTQILATRIAKILIDTDTNPSNILCLTYTDNGAVEMRNRLLKMVGTAAYNVQIHTFHSFCNEVIQDNSTYFGKLRLEPIGDLEEIDLFYKLINNIPSDNPLKRFRGEVYYEKDRLKALFSLMKKEAWTTDYLIERIQLYLQTLPTKEGFFYKKKYKIFAAGDAKPGAIADETEKMEMLRAAVNLYPVYNTMMANISRYNFDDMILWVLDAFKNNTNLLLDYQERFLYFLVDEFQDTSRSQNLLLQYLTGYWDVPNIFVVGDADQSVFSFQDANVQNIDAFRKRYAESIVQIDLINNYRSSQVILDSAHQLIINNQQRITNNDAALTASNTSLQAINIIPEIIEFTNTAQEAISIATQIEALINKGISGKDIAIIYRNHAQVEDIITILEQQKIAVNTRRKVDLLKLPFIQNIVAILTWIDKENYMPYSADDSLFQMLHCNFFNIKPLEIARLSIAVNEKNKSSKDAVFSLRRIIAEMPNIKADLFNQANSTIKSTSDELEDLLKLSNNTTLEHLVERVIQRAGVLAYIMQSTEKPWLLQVLTAFFNYVKEECKRKPDIGLHEFLNNISLMRSNNITMPLVKSTATDVGVNLVTAHGSKGSEYGYVFVIGCTQKIWDDKNTSANRTYKLPDNLVSSNNTASDLEESRRLFYVAITRAKTNLCISYSVKDKKDKDQIKSTFITELIESTTIEITQKQVSDSLLTNYLALQFAEIARPEIELVEQEYIDKVLQRYTLSVTHLNNYLSCPLKFYYQNLIKVPSAKSDSMVFGSAVHFAVERLFKTMRENDNIFAPVEKFVDDFTWYMHINRDAFTPETFKLKNDYGQKILPAYYNHHINTWSKIVVVEKPLRNIVVQGIPLNGKLDKLEFNGKTVNVVDYKTGKYDNAKKKLFAPNEKEPNGGDYWRQAVFYKILVDNDSTNDWQALSTEFEFVEPVGDTYKTEKVVVELEDITTVTQQIISTWQKIKNREFKTGCGKPECHWCNFVKTNNMAIALHELEED
ncbi:MAG: ATP-dependent helicase [Deinococcales bacterium]|nr:ATP-dependent helicase [Chitinophagaceae bacterium]